jgi:hypothetical protein
MRSYPKIANIIIFLAALGALALLGYFLFQIPGNGISQNPITDEGSWQTYTSEKYGFQVSYPENWQVSVDEKIPGIHIYKKGETKPDNLTHHTVFTHVSIYPEGIGTEGVQGQLATSTVHAALETNSLFDYVLKDGKRWATFLSFTDVPKSWQPWGFLFARVKIDNEKAVCINKGKELPVDQCDIGVEFIGSQIVRTGTIDEADRTIEEKILESFRFTPTQATTKKFRDENLGIQLEHPATWVEKTRNEGSIALVSLTSGDYEIGIQVGEGQAGGGILEDYDNKYVELRVDDKDFWRPKTFEQPFGEQQEHTIGFFFPEFGLVNEVDQQFDQYNLTLVIGKRGYNIMYGYKGNVKNVDSKKLAEMDQIVKTLHFFNLGAFTAQTVPPNYRTWKEYRNDNYGFSFKYPAGYEAFTTAASYDKNAIITFDSKAQEKILLYGYYNSYPTIQVRIFPITKYKYTDNSGGVTFNYDAASKTCIRDDMPEVAENILIIGNIKGCRFGMADAGFAMYGYYFPNHAKNVVIEVSLHMGETTSRPLDIKDILNTFSFN